MPIHVILDRMLQLSLPYGTNDDLSFLSLAVSYPRSSARISPKSHRSPKSPAADPANGQISIRRHAHSGRPQDARGLYPLCCARSSVISRRTGVPRVSQSDDEIFEIFPEVFPETSRASTHPSFTLSSLTVDLHNFLSFFPNTYDKKQSRVRAKSSSKFSSKMSIQLASPIPRDMYLDTVATFLKDRIDCSASTPRSGALACTTEIQRVHTDKEDISFRDPWNAIKATSSRMFSETLHFTLTR